MHSEFFIFRETIDEHILIVMVKDQGTPSKRNYAKVVVNVFDHNDHAPEFFSSIIEGKVFETSDSGSEVAKILAIDRDKDLNAKIVYSIVSGTSSLSFNHQVMVKEMVYCIICISILYF